jgi:hypothetical protein
MRLTYHLSGPGAIQRQILPGNAACCVKIGTSGGNCHLVVTRHGIDPQRGMFAGQALHCREPPGAVGVIGGGECQHKSVLQMRRVELRDYPRQNPRMKMRGGG